MNVDPGSIVWKHCSILGQRAAYKDWYEGKLVPAWRKAGLPESVRIKQMSTRSNLARKRLAPDSRIAELEHDLDAAQHLLHEIVIAAFRRERGRDPTTKAEYRAYHRRLYKEAVAATAART
jgi:hypothetical protein